jgi:hypothetical protein
MRTGSGLVKSLSRSIAGLFAAVIAVAALAGFPVSLIPVPHWMTYHRDRSQALWQARIGASNSWVRLSDGPG